MGYVYVPYAIGRTLPNAHKQFRRDYNHERGPVSRVIDRDKIQGGQTLHRQWVQTDDSW